MAEITDNGYQLKTQNEWFSDEEARYKAIDPNWNTGASTPDGLKLATDSEIWANLDELGQSAYNSKDPNKATGTDLDVLSSITGTLRGQGTPSTVDLTLTGDNGEVVADGALVESTENGSLWAVNGPVTIAGATAATATAVENGATQASIDTITRIVVTQAGWASVTNPSVATPGTNPDADSELRIERNNGVSLPGQNQVDSTFAAIANINGVRRVRIYENDSIPPVDSNGLPIHSTATIVDGGDDDDVALAIYNKRNPGPIQHSLTTPISVDIVSPVTGNEKTIIFNRPDYVDAIIIYNITDDGSLPANADQLVKDATLEYVGGDLLDADAGFNQSGFNIGEDVHSGRLYTPANHVIGQYGSSYVTSITVNGGAILAINFEQLSRFTDANITVNIA